MHFSNSMCAMIFNHQDAKNGRLEASKLQIFLRSKR